MFTTERHAHVFPGLGFIEMTSSSVCFNSMLGWRAIGFRLCFGAENVCDAWGHLQPACGFVVEGCCCRGPSAIPHAVMPSHPFVLLGMCMHMPLVAGVACTVDRNPAHPCCDDHGHCSSALVVGGVAMETGLHISDGELPECGA